MILGKKSTSRQSVLERGRDSMENLSLSLTSLSSSPQRSATQPSSHLLMQKRTIEIKLVSFLVDQGLLIVLFVSGFCMWILGYLNTDYLLISLDCDMICYDA